MSVREGIDCIGENDRDGKCCWLERFRGKSERLQRVEERLGEMG